MDSKGTQNGSPERNKMCCVGVSDKLFDLITVCLFVSYDCVTILIVWHYTRCGFVPVALNTSPFGLSGYASRCVAPWLWGGGCYVTQACHIEKRTAMFLVERRISKSCCKLSLSFAL